MPETIVMTINGHVVTVPAGITVLAALLQHGVTVFRKSVTGEPRGPLCGIGVCFECRVTINGQPHCRSCQILCRDGMDIRTQ